MAEEKKWYLSKTFWGAILFALGEILKIFNIDFDAAGWTEMVSDLLVVIGPILAAIGLRTAKTSISKELV